MAQHGSRVFLLSPARLDGARAAQLLRPEASFDLAVSLRCGTVTIGEAYAFISGLYFRGKVAYAAAFASAVEGVAPAFVIVPGSGLVPMDTLVRAEDLRTFSSVSINRDREAYRSSLLRDAQWLKGTTGPGCRFVLLGSVASGKYTEPLLEVFGERLLFPVDFVGRGDMSRGGLMLRSSAAGQELAYIPVAGATLRGTRPPKLAKLPRKSPL